MGANPGDLINSCSFKICGVYDSSQGNSQYDVNDNLKFIHANITNGTFPSGIEGASGSSCILEFVYDPSSSELFAFIISQSHCSTSDNSSTSLD